LREEMTGGLRIAVCIKSVPNPRQTGQLTFDVATMTLKKEGVPRIIGTMDLNALEEALRLKEEHGGTVTVFSMGSPGAADTIHQALAMGADEAYLISHPSMAGADTIATAYTLACAFRKMEPFHLTLCGAYSLYGSTGNVGPMLAEYLNLRQLTGVSRIEEIDRDMVRAEIALEDGRLRVQALMPLLITVVREINVPRGIPILGIIAARDKEVRTWSLEDIDADPKKVGTVGSPTKMIDFHIPEGERKGEIIQGKPEEVARELTARLRKLAVI
jgi:electron transfer flavoprotein beta subunit